MKIKLDNLDSGLYSEFQKKAADGNISAKDLSELSKIAEKKGVNSDEANFLKGIADKTNVDKLLKNPKALTKIDLDVDNSNSQDFIKAFNSLSDANKNDFLNLMNSTTDVPVNENYKKDPFLVQIPKQQIDNTYVKKPLYLNKEINNEKIETKKQDVLTSSDKAVLEKVLISGLLTKKDSDGKTVLQNLKEISGSKKVNGPKVMKEMINMLNPSNIKEVLKLSEKTEFANDKGLKDSNRGIDKKNGIFQKGVSPTDGLKEITQCTKRYTCGGASMEVFMKTEAPEQLVKMVKDLVTSGESKFGNRIIKNPPKSLTTHEGSSVNGKGKEDRTDLDIIIQSAFMDKIGLTSATYDIAKDDGGTLTKVFGNGGGSPKPMAHMMQDLTGKKFDYEHSLDFGLLDVGLSNLYGIGSAKSNEKLYNILDKHISKGEKVIIAYNTNPNDKLGLHYVTVLGKNDKNEYVFLDTDQEKEVGAKLFTMNETEMKNKIRCVIFQKE